MVAKARQDRNLVVSAAKFTRLHNFRRQSTILPIISATVLTGFTHLPVPTIRSRRYLADYCPNAVILWAHKSQMTPAVRRTHQICAS